MPKSELVTNQLRLLRFVNRLSKIENVTPKDEAHLLPDLIWLYKELPAKSLDNQITLRSENAAQWSKKYLSALYRMKNNPFHCFQ